MSKEIKKPIKELKKSTKKEVEIWIDGYENAIWHVKNQVSWFRRLFKMFE